MRPLNEILGTLYQDEHVLDEAGLHRTGEERSSCTELLSGELDSGAQSSLRPRVNNLHVVNGIRVTDIPQRTEKSEQDLVSLKVKTPGRHRVGTGPIPRTHLEGIKDIEQGVSCFTLALPAPIGSIAEHFYWRTLPAWLDGAIQRNGQTFDDATFPNGNSCSAGYKSPCWWLASELRGHPLFTGLSGSQIARFLDEVIAWEALPDFDCYHQEMHPRDALIDAIGFQIEHEIRPLSLSVSPSQAFELAKTFPLELTERNENYRRTVSLLFWYQALLGQHGKFFLAVETLAKLLTCSTRTSAAYLTRAKREALIKLVRECDRGKRLAREWRWVADVEIVVKETK